jgi:hypothetical protein
MKKKLLFTRKKQVYILAMAACFIANYGWSQQELVLNGTTDEYTLNTGDNSDAFDMTPNSTVQDNTGATVDSPYYALWRNDDLETYLEQTYNSGGAVDEQPGSSSDGTYDENGVKTRSVKLYDDGSPAIIGSSRRLYQKIVVEAGEQYTFSIDSRSEAINVPSEVFILNEEITTEVGLENGASDTRVDYYLEITNDHNPSSGGVSNNTFTNNSFDFTATNATAVIYVRAMGAVDSSTEVFYDNISMIKKEVTASVEDVFGDDFGIYPNPAHDVVQISSKATIDTVEIFDIIGKKMMEFSDVSNNTINISNLPKGVYFVQLKSGKASITKKLIQQ